MLRFALQSVADPAEYFVQMYRGRPMFGCLRHAVQFGEREPAVAVARAVRRAGVPCLVAVVETLRFVGYDPQDFSRRTLPRVREAR